MTPTARTLARLRADGYMAAVVERWNPHARIRQDLFGWCDVLAARHDGTLAVQACVSGDITKRVTKAQGTEGLHACLSAGWRCEVWWWALRGPRGARKLWTVRRVDLATGAEVVEANATPGGDGMTPQPMPLRFLLHRGAP